MLPIWMTVKVCKGPSDGKERTVNTDILGPIDAPDRARAVRVLIVDGRAVVRQGLRTFLELQDDVSHGDPVALPIEVVGTWNSPGATSRKRRPGWRLREPAPG